MCNCWCTTGMWSVHLIICIVSYYQWWVLVLAVCIVWSARQEKQTVRITRISISWYQWRDKKEQKSKRTTPGIPTWSPTVVLTGPDDAWLRWADGKRYCHRGMVVPDLHGTRDIHVQYIRSTSRPSQTNSNSFRTTLINIPPSHYCNPTYWVLQTNN